MKPEQQDPLERRVHQLLKALPEVTAPATLVPRVMASVAARFSLPWYRQSWQTWPFLLQVVTLVVVVASFGALTFAAWQLGRAAGLAAVRQEIGEMFSGVGAVWNVLSVLLGAIRLVVGRLGTGFLVGCLAAAALAYALFVGLGTVYLRLMFAQRQQS
jgi:hypothetical protein